MEDGNYPLQKAYEAILNNDFEQAEAWFEEAIAADPENADYHYRLSITYARSNKMQKAAFHAETAVKLKPEREMYKLHLRTLQARELLYQAERVIDGSTAQPYLAIELLKQAVALDPLSVEAFLLLSVAAEAAGDYAQAVKAVKDALLLDPQHEAALTLLPQTERKLSQYLGMNTDTK